MCASLLVASAVSIWSPCDHLFMVTSLFTRPHIKEILIIDVFPLWSSSMWIQPRWEALNCLKWVPLCTAWRKVDTWESCASFVWRFSHMEKETGMTHQDKVSFLYAVPKWLKRHPVTYTDSVLKLFAVFKCMCFQLQEQRFSSGVAVFVKTSTEDSSYEMHFYVKASYAAHRLLAQCLHCSS